MSGGLHVTDRLSEIRKLEQRTVIGLNIGTSLDGIDAALLRVRGAGLETVFGLDAFEIFPLPQRLKDQLLHPELLGVEAIAGLNRDLGQLLAESCSHLAKSAGCSLHDVHIVGSHGATVFHQPPRRATDRGVTLQLGDGAIIAEGTGALVVSNFRAADMAAGGQGAPLMPYLDYLLFRDQPGTVLLNLGGIANVCYVADDLEEVLAFDTGPANLPLNEITRILTKGSEQFDRDGRLAAVGSIDNLLLDHLMATPFLTTPPPKSTGREEFGETWVKEVLEKNKHKKLVDILATMTAFVAKSVHDACQKWIEPRPLRCLIVSGGGVHNATLMHHLRKNFAPMETKSLMELGYNPDAKESILFALLANDRIFERPSNLPSATGALWPVSLGQIN